MSNPCIPPARLPRPRTLSARGSRALYERHRDRVYLVCLRKTGNASDALDASQETFVRVFANLGRFRGPSLARWIQAIALNASRDVLRKCERRERSLEALDRTGFRRIEARGAEERCPPPEHACLGRECTEAVGRALARLSPPLREAVRLRYLEGLPYESVANELGLPIGTVKSRLARAHEALARLLEPSRALLGAG